MIKRYGGLGGKVCYNHLRDEKHGYNCLSWVNERNAPGGPMFLFSVRSQR